MRRLASLRIVIGFLSALCLSLATTVAAHGSESAELAHPRAGSPPDRSLAVPVKAPARKAFHTSIESLEARRMLSAAVQGLTAEYYPTQNLTGTATTRVDANVSFNWGLNAPISGMPRDRFSVRWRGEIQADFSELYTFIVNGDEGMRVWINRQLIIDAWGSNKSLTKSGTIQLEAGQRYEIQIDFFDRKDQALIHLYWSSASQAKSLVPTAALYPMLSPPTLDPHWISNRIEMEDFDYTGNLVAYFDSTLGNAGGQYRSTNVDIGQSGDTGGGYHIGWTSPGEWLNYTVNVPTSGTYLLNMRVASSGLGGTFHVELNGTDVSGAISVPDTGGSSTWQTVTVGNIALTAGIHSLRIVMDTAGASGYVGNFNWMQFSPAVVETEVPNITVFSGGTQIQNGQLVPVTFPTTYQGDPGPSMTFLVINDGTAELALSSPTLPAGFLLVEGLVSSLAPGASDTFTVQLSTAQPGAYSGNLSIASNDPGTPQFQFSVAGEVIVLGSGESRILVPGSGWTGPTPQPPTNGTGQGADAMAIARWDVVPYQTFDGQFNVGVVAFHMNGIQKVSFSVEGGEWIDVTTPTLNTQVGGNGWDGVVEYWATLDASLFTASGQIELRAIAYPTVGVPRVLDSLYLWVDPTGANMNPGAVYVSLTGSDTNAGTRESPYASLSQALAMVPDGGEVILLDEGTYTLADRGQTTYRANQRWVTIKSDEGLSRENVRIASPDGIARIRTRMFLVKWEGITLDLQSTWQYTPEPGDHVWFDDSIWTYNGWENTTASNGNQFPTPVKEWRGGLWITNSLAHDVYYGFTLSDLTRNSHVDRVSGDAFQSSWMVINSSASNVDGSISSHHTDIFQWWGNKDNVIVYGFEAIDHIRAQSIFLQPLTGNQFTNFAFVDVHIRNIVNPDGTTTYFSQMQQQQSHMLFRNLNLESQQLLIRTSMEFVGHNVLFENSRLHVKTLATAPPPGVEFRNCTPSYPLYAPPLTQGSTSAYSFSLTHNLYQPAIRVLVTGPNGYTQIATLIGTTNISSTTVHTYQIIAPEGGWNGAYTLSLENGGLLGTFTAAA